jgi:hypothetical protein
METLSHRQVSLRGQMSRLEGDRLHLNPTILPVLTTASSAYTGDQDRQ